MTTKDYEWNHTTMLLTSKCHNLLCHLTIFSRSNEWRTLLTRMHDNWNEHVQMFIIRLNKNFLSGFFIFLTFDFGFGSPIKYFTVKANEIVNFAPLHCESLVFIVYQYNKCSFVTDDLLSCQEFNTLEFGKNSSNKRPKTARRRVMSFLS